MPVRWAISRITDMHKSTVAKWRLVPYKHFCVLQSLPLGGRSRQSGRQGGHLFTSRGPPVGLWWLATLGVVTEEASHHNPANGIRLEADPVSLE